MAYLFSPYSMSFLLGVICAAALPPLNSLPLTLVALIGFFWLYMKKKPKRTGLYSYLFAFGYFLLGLYWIGNALLVEGNAYRWAWPLAVIGLPLGLSLFYGLAGWFTGHFFKNTPQAFKALFLCHAFVTAEWIRSYVFTGFPWNLMGTAWSDYLILMQSASIIGLLGLTWLMLLIAYLVALACYTNTKKTRLIAGFSAISLIAVNAIFGLYALKTNDTNPDNDAPPVHVITIQPNIPQHEKWDRLYLQQNIDKLIATTLDGIAEQPVDNGSLLIIWPETALSYQLIENKSFLTQLIQRFSAAANTNEITFITGALTRHYDAKADKMRYQNAALYINNQGEIFGQYSKTHLVPFGEYIPFQQYIPLKTVTGFSGFTKGNGPELQTINSHIKLMNKICYEIIFPSEFSVKSSTNQSPNGIVHITNDAWYGPSSGPYQHLNITRWRAIDNNTHVFRAANKGISASITPNGYLKNQAYISKQSSSYIKFYSYKTNASLYILVGIWLCPLLLALMNTILLIKGLKITSKKSLLKNLQNLTF